MRQHYVFKGRAAHALTVLVPCITGVAVRKQTWTAAEIRQRTTPEGGAKWTEANPSLS